MYSRERGGMPRNTTTTTTGRNSMTCRCGEHQCPPIGEGEVDTSGAALVVIDGRELKEKSYTPYVDLVRYRFSLLQKIHLMNFTDHGSPNVDGGLVSHEEEELEHDGHYHPYANFAIHEFNHLRKDMKLRLVKLVKVNTVFGCGFYLYMTFSVVDELSGNTSTYQAAVASFARGGRVLGLFRDRSNDKILAILSITVVVIYLLITYFSCYHLLNLLISTSFGVKLIYV